MLEGRRDDLSSHTLHWEGCALTKAPIELLVGDLDVVPVVSRVVERAPTIRVSNDHRGFLVPLAGSAETNQAESRAQVATAPQAHVGVHDGARAHDRHAPSCSCPPPGVDCGARARRAPSRTCL